MVGFVGQWPHTNKQTFDTELCYLTSVYIKMSYKRNNHWTNWAQPYEATHWSIPDVYDNAFQLKLKQHCQYLEAEFMSWISLLTLYKRSYSAGKIHYHNCFWKVRTNFNWDFCLFLHFPISGNKESRADGQRLAPVAVFVAAFHTSGSSSHQWQNN